MKNLKLLAYLTIILITGCGHKLESTQPQIISLKNENNLRNQFEIFDKEVSDIPNFSVDQYHPGLKDLFNKEGISHLCMPVILSTLLIQKLVQDKKYTNLTLNGLDKAQSQVDANAVIRQLLPCLKYSPDRGTSIRKSANCLSEIGTQNNIPIDVKIISASGGTTKLLPGIEQINKLPELADIKTYIEGGYKIIAGVDFFYKNVEGKITSDSGHYIAIHGYALRNDWPQDSLHVYVTDPVFKFWKSMPKAHLALLTKNPNLKLSNWATNINIKSPTLGSLKDEVFLSELLIFK